MKIHRLYTDKNGESHFEDVQVEFKEATRSGRLSARLPATASSFREVSPDYDLDWASRPAPPVHHNLDAGVQLTASDGETRRIRRGEVILVGGHAGQGASVEGGRHDARHCIFVTLE